jgi:hypothetical protein
MSTSTEITRLQTARNTIRDKAVELGIAASTAKLDALATAIDGITNQGAVSAQVQEGSTYTIPKGYHNGSGTVSGVSGGGNYTLQSKTVTPTKNQQNVTPDSGFYGLSDVTVAPIPEAYQNVSSVDATAADVLANKVIVTADGKVTTGTMPNIGAATATLSTSATSYTIPKGYHSGTGKVSITTETKSATPTKSAQDITPSSGKVLSKVTVDAIPDNYVDTSDATVTAADVLDGKTVYIANKIVEGTMPNKGSYDMVMTPFEETLKIPKGYHDGTGVVSVATENKTVTPTKSTITVSPDASYYLNRVTVNPIPAAYQDVTGVTATAGTVLTGSKFVDSDGDVVDGTMPNNGAVSGTLNASTTSYTVPAGYHSGTGKVSITLETKTATPTKSAQDITPTSGKVLSKVTVNAIPAAYQDVTGVTATAAQVLDGAFYVTAAGVKTEGTMANNGAISKSIDGLTTTSTTIPAGYTSGGTVSLTSAIEDALAAI